MPRGSNIVNGRPISKAEMQAQGIPLGARHARRPAKSVTPSAPPSETSNVIPIRGAVGLSDALAALPSGPGPAEASNLESSGPAAGAPPSAVTTPAASTSNDSFCSIAGTLTAHVAVLGMAGQIRRAGIEPRQPDDDDIEAAAEQTALAYRRGLGDAEVPWWAGLFAAYGQLYLDMRMQGRKLTSDELEEQRQPKEAAPAKEEPPATRVAATMTTPKPAATPKPAPLA